MGNSATISVVTSQDAGSLLLGGSFSLSFSGFVWTAQIPTNATNAQIGAALLALPEVANVKVTREPTSAAVAMTVLTLYVVVLLPVVNLPPLMINGSQLTGTGLSTYVSHSRSCRWNSPSTRSPASLALTRLQSSSPFHSLFLSLSFSLSLTHTLTLSLSPFPKCLRSLSSVRPCEQSFACNCNVVPRCRSLVEMENASSADIFINTIPGEWLQVCGYLLPER